MRISNLITSNQYRYKPSFKSNDDEWHVFGFDEGGQPVRDYIRQWHDEYYNPYPSLDTGRKSDFEINQIISELTQKPVVNNRKLRKTNIWNLANVSGTIYRGAIIKPDELDKVEKLHKAGIRRIIRIAEKSPELEKECKKFNMEYLDILFDDDDIDAFKIIDEVESEAKEAARHILGYDEKKSSKFVNDCINDWQDNTRIFIDKFIQYIQTIQKGNVFIGCQCGVYDTDIALMFNYLFNPKMEHYNRCTRGRIDKFIDQAESLYLNMTESDKIKMGWTKDYEPIFHKKLENLKNP